ncbi:LOW QUALITY PROTEIN: hypothetical protein CFOL_v3_13900, partial [Cephalotus follicularis]
EVAHSNKGISLSQRKYTLDLLQETGMLECKPADTQLEPNSHLKNKEGEPVDKGSYRRLVGRLIYLTHTRPDIAFIVSVVSQYMHDPHSSHLKAVYRILRYLKSSLLRVISNRHMDLVAYSDADWAGSAIDRRSTTGYCTFVGGNLVSWRSKKQTTVARSSAEAEYRAMACGAELMWLRSLLLEMGLLVSKPMKMFCDNQAVIYIASNPVYHERTKHIEVDCHFVRDAVMKKLVETPFVSSSGQLADVLTKSLFAPNFRMCCNKLSMGDLYA